MIQRSKKNYPGANIARTEQHRELLRVEINGLKLTFM